MGFFLDYYDEIEGMKQVVSVSPLLKDIEKTLAFEKAFDKKKGIIREYTITKKESYMPEGILYKA
jgi:hypothetical protein